MLSMDLTFHHRAEAEYLAARDWYRRRAPGLGQAFQESVSRSVEAIRNNPLSWPKYGRRLRWVKTRRFPYLLYFDIQDDSRIVVVAVAHARRRRGYWHGRMN